MLDKCVDHKAHVHFTFFFDAQYCHPIANRAARTCIIHTINTTTTTYYIAMWRSQFWVTLQMRQLISYYDVDILCHRVQL
jgi:hypothetical protein